MEDKTALMELIEWFNKFIAPELQVINDAKNYHPNDVIKAKAKFSVLIEISTKAAELLEVEKKNIVDAYNDGYGGGSMRSKREGKGYYSTKYNNQK